MEPELQLTAEEDRPTTDRAAADQAGSASRVPEPGEGWGGPSYGPGHGNDGFDWIFIGPEGLRAGCSILLFYGLYWLFRIVVGTIFYGAGLVGDTVGDSAPSVFFVELIPFISMIAAAAILALLERRRLLSYNLTGPRRALHFVVGAVAGFVALSLLIAMLAFGGWLRFAPAAISAGPALRSAAMWGAAFLIVACVEEGLFRCFGLFTLTRGINFWWALLAEIAVCADVAVHARSNGAWGVYLAALLGLVPCFVLQQRAVTSSAFWQAAWVTSTFFGFYHTLNSGENWIGVFAAALIGFVLCVSVRLTGSAWWAIGFHAAWDWAETFFYGTADSGLTAQGNLLSASPAGNPLWSGGTDGPEGSLLVIGVVLALLLFVLAVYGRRRGATAIGA